MDESKKKGRYEDAKKFVRYSDGAKMYSMGMTKFQEVAKDANRQMSLSMLMNRRKQIVQQLPVVLVETLVVSL